MRSEEVTQELIADYLRARYPEVLFHSDYGSGSKLTMSQAVRQKRLNGGIRGWPDIFIAEPRGIYKGLFIELKRDGVRLQKKDGSWVNAHIAEQAEMLLKLQEKGYWATFAVGFNEAKATIDQYLAEKHWADQEAIERFVKMLGAETWRTNMGYIFINHEDEP
jgi:hypothetical protein